MKDLASSLLVTRGGATRLIARLESKGLVRRISTPGLQAVEAELTAAGESVLTAAMDTHFDGVRRLFISRLEPGDLQSLRRCLLQSPTEHGFGTELWTLKRVQALIKRLHGVAYGQTQVWRILGSLGFSAQKPEKRALERDE